MDNNMLAELDEVVRLMEAATPGKWKGYRAQKYTHLKSEVGDYVMEARLRGQVRNPPDAAYIAALHNLFRTHHATLADMAKRLEAVERDSKRLDFMEREHCTVRVEATCDDDVFYEVVDYYMAEPQERVIGSGATPRDALDAAIDATQEGEG